MDRREFVGQAAVAGLALGIELGAEGVASAKVMMPPFAGFKPGAFLTIEETGVITFVLDRVEMGQGTMTALAALVAEELDVDLKDLEVRFAPADRVYVNPQLGMQMTGGSTSVAAAWVPLRKAGAAARELLIAAAAAAWGVPASACQTKHKTVYHAATGKSAGYGELARAAALLPIPKEPKLKDPKDHRLIGKPMARLDAAAKSTGTAGYGIDVTLPDLRVALVKRAPAFGATVKSFDAKAALKMPGVEHVVQISTGVAVVARRFWQAKAAAETVTVDWDLGPNAKLTSEALMERFAASAKTRSDQFDGKGKTGAALTSASKTLFAEYRVPYLAHAAMEPGNCTARVTKDLCEVWAPTQGPGLAQQLAAEITGLDHERVKIHTTYLGGGFGRRLYQDYVVEAVELSKLIGKAVKVQWTREDDMRHDFYRPATVHHVKAALDAKGVVTGWAQCVVGQSIIAQAVGDWMRAIVPQWLPQGLKGAGGSAVSGIFKAFGQDPTATEGAEDMDYGIPALAVDYVYEEAPIPVGFWRAVGHSFTGFVVESFLDEIAHAAGQEPLALRRQLLADRKRSLGVLELAVAKADWTKPLPAGVFRGVAQHASFGTCVAQVAEVSVEGTSIKVHRIVCAVDCGRVINPDGVEAQIAGGIIFGLSAALGAEVTIKDGGVAQSNFHDFPVLRLTEVPKIEVHVVPSEAAPKGVGEPGLPPVAAAVANAVFAATGQRLRSLPLRLS